MDAGFFAICRHLEDHGVRSGQDPGRLQLHAAFGCRDASAFELAFRAYVLENVHGARCGKRAATGDQRGALSVRLRTEGSNSVHGPEVGYAKAKKDLTSIEPELTASP